MRVLVACERSGVVRDAFRARGHEAWSCDLEPDENGSPYHIQRDVLTVLLPRFHLRTTGLTIHNGWDLMIAHPPCTYLCSSGLHWNRRVPGRAEKTEEALKFVQRLMEAPVRRKCIENPPGRIGTAIRKADQYIHPHQFGHDASKTTGLWLEELPKLVPTEHVEPRMVDGLPRWANQTDSGQNRLGPSPTRAADRARTYPGIAEAMAEQWGDLT